MPLMNATAANLEADLGIPHCVFSGNKEKPGSRVIPDLATLKQGATQQHTWSLDGINARTLAGVNARVKNMLNPMAIRRLRDESLGMMPKAEGSATLALMSWMKKLGPYVEEAMVGSANWFGDLIAWIGDHFSDPNIVDATGIVDFTNSPFCNPDQLAGPYALPHIGETILFELLRSSLDPGLYNDITVHHKACVGSRGSNLQILILCYCMAKDRPWKEKGRNVFTSVSERCVSGSAARPGDSILQLRHNVREVVYELALVVALTAGTSHVALHMLPRYVLLQCITGSRSVLHPLTGSAKTDFEKWVAEGGMPTIKELTDRVDLTLCDDGGSLPAVNSHGKEVPIDKSYGSSLAPPPPPPADSEASVHEVGLEEAQVNELGICFRFLKGNCQYGDTCKFAHVKQKKRRTDDTSAVSAPPSGAGSASAPSSASSQGDFKASGALYICPFNCGQTECRGRQTHCRKCAGYGHEFGACTKKEGFLAEFIGNEGFSGRGGRGSRGRGGRSGRGGRGRGGGGGRGGGRGRGAEQGDAKLADLLKALVQHIKE